ncbi:MAG: YciI family protein [Actinomycetota bacterium]|nr:YciI family protein [Actinomycetota bacterium]
MPKYMITIVENQDAYTDTDANDADFGAVMQMHGDFAESVSKAGGEILGGEALQPISTATFLRNTRTDDVSVMDNPLPDVKEVLGGYYLVSAKDDAQALEFAKLCPAPQGYVELRPVWEFDAS